MQPEARVRSRAERLWRSLGAWVIRLAPTAGNGLDEMPDALVLFPGGRLVFVEYKAPKGTLREGQRKTLAALATMGYDTAVVRGDADARSVATDAVGAL